MFINILSIANVANPIIVIPFDVRLKTGVDLVATFLRYFQTGFFYHINQWRNFTTVKPYFSNKIRLYS